MSQGGKAGVLEQAKSSWPSWRRSEKWSREWEAGWGPRTPGEATQREEGQLLTSQGCLPTCARQVPTPASAGFSGVAAGRRVGGGEEPARPAPGTLCALLGGPVPPPYVSLSTLFVVNHSPSVPVPHLQNGLGNGPHLTGLPEDSA